MRTPFKEISIGGSTKEDLIQRLLQAGVQFNEYARVLFEHPQFRPSEKSEKVKLVKIGLADLKLGNPFSFQEMIRRASDFGLKPCPLYLGFLRLEYMDQAEGPHLTIVSLKPESDESHPNGFYIRNHEGAQWLRGYRADDFSDWPVGGEFVFIR